MFNNADSHFGDTNFLRKSQRNYFVNGNFESNSDFVCYHLEIDEITEDEYNSSNFVNVVEDKTLKDNKYFRISFYKYDEDIITSIDIINLQDADPKTNAIPISYSDDNGIIITPTILMMSVTITII